MSDEPKTIRAHAVKLARDISVLAAAFTVMTALVAGPFRSYGAEFSKWLFSLEEPRGGNCLIIPSYSNSNRVRHSISPAAPGEWAVITWRNINRLRADCGPPVAIGMMSNGDAIVHRVALSIGTGIELRTGVQDLKYSFRVPDDVSPGEGYFWVSVSFPNAVGGSAPEISDPVPFVILERESIE